MKTALLLSLLLVHPAAALEVHEWGTFTALTGSRDGTVTWYQPHADLSRLPEFVGKNTGFSNPHPPRCGWKPPCCISTRTRQDR